MKQKNSQRPVGIFPETSKLLMLREHDPSDIPSLSEEIVDRLAAHIERYGRRCAAEIVLENGRFKVTAFSVEDDSTHRLCGGIDAGVFTLVTELHRKMES